MTNLFTKGVVFATLRRCLLLHVVGYSLGLAQTEASLTPSTLVAARHLSTTHENLDVQARIDICLLVVIAQLLPVHLLRLALGLAPILPSTASSYVVLHI